MVGRRACMESKRWLFNIGVCLATWLGGLGVGGADEPPGGRDQLIWIEGESPSAHSFNGHPWYSGETSGASNQPLALDLLSPSQPGEAPEMGWAQWLVHSGGEESTADAEYQFELQEGDRDFTLWARASTFAQSAQFQMDSGDAIILPISAAQEDVNLRAERADLESLGIDTRFLGWMKIGTFRLGPGIHTIGVSVFNGAARNGNRYTQFGLDALALANYSWAPAGAYEGAKPEEFSRVDEFGAAHIYPETLPTPSPDTWFPFRAGPIDIDNNWLDRSVLVEAPAGERGALRRVGASFEFADGTPFKAWGIGAAPPDDPELMAEQARFFRSYGVNMIRAHTVAGILGPLEDDGTGGRRFAPDKLDHFDRWFAALKAEGVYSTWSVFWKETISEADGYDPALYADLCSVGDHDCDGIIDNENAPEAKKTYGVVNIAPGIQDIRWDYLRRLMSHTNPYTGLKYAEDPALAILEVQNEDTIFFHTPLNDIAADNAWPEHSRIFREGFADWIREHYPDEASWRSAWGNGIQDGDAFDAGELAVYAAWQMHAEDPYFGQGADGQPFYHRDRRRRMGDFQRYCATIQRDYWTRWQRRLNDLGYEGILMGTAWKAGGNSARAANIYADDALDAIDRHSYFGGSALDWRIVHDVVNNRSHMDISQWREPGGKEQSLFLKGFEQVEDKPFSLTEWSQRTPNQWRAEATPIFAFYGMGLHDWDASYNFAAGKALRVDGGWPNQSPYAAHTPVYMGQFPALSTAVLRGDITPGEIVAARRLTVGDALSGYDVFSQAGPLQDDENEFPLPAEVFGLGRVTVKIGEGLEPSFVGDWSGWDRDGKRITSTTGELIWDYGQRYVEVRAEKTQGIIGFAGGKTIELPDVTVRMESPFASLLFTALDDLPIRQSTRILVTALAREKLTGSRMDGEGDETMLTAIGGPPLLLEPVKATIQFRGDTFVNAIALGHQGQQYEPLENWQIPTGDDGYTIDGRYQTLYYLFTRAQSPEPPAEGNPGVFNDETMPTDGHDAGGTTVMEHFPAGSRAAATAATEEENEPHRGTAMQSDEGCDCHVVGHGPRSNVWLTLLLCILLSPLLRRQR